MGQHGKNTITKRALAIICLFSFAILTAFIFPKFGEKVQGLCQQYTPYVACEHTNIFFSGIGSIIVAITVPIASYKWLCKQAMWKLALLNLSTITFIIFGAILLKNEYEQSLKAK